MDILVKAVFPRGGFGFDGLSRRRDGDEFTIDEALFSEDWMVRVEGEVEPPSVSAAAEKLASEAGVDLSAIEGTGKNGNVTKGDVQAVIDAA